MGFRVLVGDPTSKGPRLGLDNSLQGERGVRGLDVESYIRLSRGALRKCGDPSDCIGLLGSCDRDNRVRPLR